ncbi:non-ribosomal peptide synthetase component F [Bradyrhizobium sp. LB13.1]
MTGDIVATISKAREHSIGDLLRRSAGREPDRLAVSCGNVSWTFAEMDAICNRLSRGLLGLGVKKGDRLAVLSRNSPRLCGAPVRGGPDRRGAGADQLHAQSGRDQLHPEELRRKGARGRS